MKYIFYLFIIVAIAFCIKNKIKINFISFFKKGFKPIRGKFGVYCYCGKQGSGKTYSCVEFLKKNKHMRIYANLKSLSGIEYNYINGLKELLELRKEHDCIIMYDEIFTEITKHDKLSKDVLDFLCQMRKRQIIFITTAQEWGELPLTLRRYVRFQVQCSLKRIPFISGLTIKKVYDAVVMVQNYKSGKLQGSGSGFVYKTDSKYGYIMTNQHVVEGSTSLKVMLTSNKVVDADLLGGDEYLDIAVIRIPVGDVKAVATIGKTSDIQLGDFVFTIGSPVGEEYFNSVTSGIISGLNRQVTVSVKSQNDWLMDVIQVDAAINPGNSGGPLLN